jgi:excisionase family DNA binding protein
MSTEQNRPTDTDQQPPHAPVTTRDGIAVMWNPTRYPVSAQRPQRAGMSGNPPTVPPTPSPWLTVREGAAYARCGVKVIYRAVESGRLRAVKLGGRRELRLTREWIDQWLLASATPTAA